MIMRFGSVMTMAVAMLLLLLLLDGSTCSSTAATDQSDVKRSAPPPQLRKTRRTSITTSITEDNDSNLTKHQVKTNPLRMSHGFWIRPTEEEEHTSSQQQRQRQNDYDYDNDDNDGGPPVVTLTSPPMGFMSWERFRCQTNCNKYPNECINEDLYKSIADVMFDDGYVSEGYNRIHIDDCWTSKLRRARNSTTGELLPDPKRFPSGIPALSEYLNSKGISLGIYSDAASKTCAGYEGSGNGNQYLDVMTFVTKWNVDYIKLDGCHLDTPEDLHDAYMEFGNAIKRVAKETNKTLIYSCSWPAYLNYNKNDEDPDVPYDIMYNKAGCNVWRNWHDIDNTWSSLSSIILHWSVNWRLLAKIPSGAYNDADMILAGDDHYGKILPIKQAQLQLGFWSIISSPLLIGGDIRTITPEYRKLLLNGYLISINQDPSHQPATCLVGCIKNNNDKRSVVMSRRQVWGKALLTGYNSIHNFAIGFFNLDKYNATDSLTYEMELQEQPKAVLCSDIWSSNPEHNVCPNIISQYYATSSSSSLLDTHHEQHLNYDRNLTNNNDNNNDWDIQLTQNENGTTWFFQISALNIPTTSHRLMRLYFTYPDFSRTATTTAADAFQELQQFAFQTTKPSTIS